MSTDSHVAPSQTPAAAGGPGVPGLASCIVQRADGVYMDPTVAGSVFQGAIEHIFAGGYMMVGLDYAVLIKAIYGHGPDFPRTDADALMMRLASDIVPFDPVRRALYRALKINGGKAEYYFEQVYLSDPGDPDCMGMPAQLDVDEFVADMWGKGIRYGINIGAVRSAIATSKSERVVVAQRLDAVPGPNAEIIEVSDHLHRSDAPRQLANGKLDLMAFQNRFPQIQEGVRLLKKIPRGEGVPGYELSGLPIVPGTPDDVDLGPMAGPGTVIDRSDDGEFLVSQQAGFLSIDGATGQLAVSDKIISRDGVSARTTGNLQLTGDYEEFGEVQEKRVVEGESITLHADVFGNIVSRGGTVLLNRNLVGGSVHNARGDITVIGVASGSVIQASEGNVVLARAESCIISGTRVTVQHAVNCEIIGDTITVKHAEGCALAARSIDVETAGPRKQSEMLIFALQPDSARVDEVIGLMNARIDEFAQVAAARKAEMDRLTNEPEVRKYVMLASKIRKKELVLTPEQVPQFQKMAIAVGPSLKAIAQVSLDVKAAETEQQAGEALVAQLRENQVASEGVSRVAVRLVQGDTLVRSMKFNPDGSSIYDLPAKDIKVRLRGSTDRAQAIFDDSFGSVDWNSEQQP